MDLNNLYGYDNVLKTFLTIYKDSSKTNKKIIIKRLDSLPEEEVCKILTGENLSGLSASLIDIMLKDGIFGVYDVEGFLDCIDDDKQKFEFIKNSHINARRSSELKPYKLTDIFYVSSYPDECFEYAKKENLEFCFKYIKINLKLHSNFLCSEYGKEILSIRLKQPLTHNELVILAKSYIGCNKKEELDYIKEILKETGQYTKFINNVMKLCI